MPSVAELAHGEKSHTQSLTQLKLIWCLGNWSTCASEKIKGVVFLWNTV